MAEAAMAVGLKTFEPDGMEQGEIARRRWGGIKGALAYLGLKESERKLMLLLICFCNSQTGQCNPSELTLAAVLDVRPETIFLAKKRLRELGLIDWESDGSRAGCRYSIAWDKLEAARDDSDRRVQEIKTRDRAKRERRKQTKVADITCPQTGNQVEPITCPQTGNEPVQLDPITCLPVDHYLSGDRSITCLEQGGLPVPRQAEPSEPSLNLTEHSAPIKISGEEEKPTPEGSSSPPRPKQFQVNGKGTIEPAERERLELNLSDLLGSDDGARRYADSLSDADLHDHCEWLTANPDMLEIARAKMTTFLKGPRWPGLT
jgi:hypothetical protein